MYGQSSYQASLLRHAGSTASRHSVSHNPQGHRAQGHAQQQYGNDAADPRLWQWFSAVDVDRSGAISARELQAALVNGQSFIAFACLCGSDR
jgi:hypothetical protein